MGNGISVKADLTGCNIIFLVPITDGIIDALSLRAMQALLDRGINNVRTMTIVEATEKLVEFQQTHGHIPDGQKFLKVTPRGNITQLFY